MRISFIALRLIIMTGFILSFFACSEAQQKKEEKQVRESKQSGRWNWLDHEKDIIDYAKKYPVSDIEKSLPQQDLDSWFRAIAGQDIEWKINDCSKQIKVPPGWGRDFPLCVEVKTKKFVSCLIIVNIEFGTFKHGISRMKPVVRNIYISYDLASGYVRNLSDLPKHISWIKQCRFPV